jgi:SAM-dependent methyltransferase
MAQPKLVLRTYIQNRHEVVPQARHQFSSGNGLHGVTTTEVGPHHLLDLGHVALADGSKSTEQPDCLVLAREAVEDTFAFPARLHKRRSSQDLQMPRRIGEGQTGPRGQFVDASLPLGEMLQQFQPMRMAHRARDLGEAREDCLLGSHLDIHFSIIQTFTVLIECYVRFKRLRIHHAPSPLFVRLAKKVRSKEIAAVGADDRQAHWDSTYVAKSEREVSWFQESAQPSLDLIETVCTPSSSVIDIGGGAAHLVDGLLERAFRDVSVLDISSSALTAAQRRMGRDAERVQWIVADVVTWAPPRTYDVWHDRAAFHFLVAEPDRAAYLLRLAQALRPGGHAIIATFGPDGPDSCSGLPVMRYDAESLGFLLGPSFRLVNTLRHAHVTPEGRTQAFQFSTLRRLPGAAA